MNAETDDDARLRERIVGTWEITETRRKFLFFTLHVTARKTYDPDGTWEMTNLIHETGESNVRWTGSWEIIDGVLHERLEHSNVPTRSPLGTVTAAVIRRLDDRVLDLTESDSDPNIWHRA